MTRRLRISDHALVRFLERAGGLDVESVREHLSTSLERARTAAGAVAVTEYVVIADGLSYVVKDSTVVTVLDGPASRGSRGTS